MMDIGVFEATDHLDDGVDFADVTEELVAEAFARARALHQACDVDKLDRGRNDLCECDSFESVSRRASGTVTTPRLGSIVQNG